ncbi:MAG: hypothetical protein RLZZ536_2776 [Planctomycetota bacterium]
MNRGRNLKQSDPVCSAVFEAGELVPQDLELFQVPRDQRLVIQRHAVFFVVFCGFVVVCNDADGNTSLAEAVG